MDYTFTREAVVNLVEDVCYSVCDSVEDAKAALGLSDRQAIALLVGGAAVSYVAYHKLKGCSKLSELRRKIAVRNAERERGFSRVEKFWHKATPEQCAKRDEILSLRLTQLHDDLMSGKYTAVEVVRAFQCRAVEATRKTNCVTEMVAEAEEWAAEVDKAAKTYRPPLFGLPFSVKESVSMTGYDSTRGYAADLGHPAKADATIVATLRQLGAIPICRTNVPQSLLSFSCSNPIYGTTCNPYNPDRTSGGSSGGEAALLALGGAVFGIGGDVGGSIRMPAHFCGIAGIKPSERRISQAGSAGSVPGRQMVCSSVGPMSQDVQMLALVMRNLTTSLTYGRDPYVAPVPWRKLLFTGDLGPGTRKKLTIGLYAHDGFFAPTPAVVRALYLAKEALEAQGHKVVEVTPPRVKEAFYLFTACATSDGGAYIGNKLADDIIDPLLTWQYPLFRISVPTKRRLAWLLRPFMPRMTELVNALPLNIFEMRETFAAVKTYREEFVGFWKANGLDAIICPPQVSPALPHAAPMKVLPTVSYTALYNVLDFPAGSVPVTRVTAEDERRTEDEYPTDDAMDRIVKDANVRGSQGLPVGVQCVALPFEEEIVLRLMNEIQEYFKKNN